MVMSYIFTGMVFLSLVAAIVTGNQSALAAAIPNGAQKGITLAISLAGSLLLWSGLGKLMEKVGITAALSKLLQPLLRRVFPTTKKDSALAGSLSANICANFLGLGNAATPMGIQAAQRLASYCKDGCASHELCRLIVLNTASIQLIPTTVAAMRAAAGSSAPFDILPAVWLTSLCSALGGLIIAWTLGKLWKRD